MGLIGLLCFLIIVLIAVISSEKIKKLIGSFAENIVFRAIPYLFNLLIGVILIVVIGLFIKWGWNKLHKIYPEMWSLSETIAMILLFIGVIIIWRAANYLEQKFKKKYGDTVVQRVFDRIGIVIKNFWLDLSAFVLILVGGCFLSIIFIRNNKIVEISIISGFSSYLIIKYLILPLVRLVRKKKIKD